MNEGLFPSMKPVIGFNKVEKAYLIDLLSSELINLAKLVTEGAIDEENLVNAILKKLRAQ